MQAIPNINQFSLGYFWKTHNFPKPYYVLDSMHGFIWSLLSSLWSSLSHAS